MKAFEKYLFWCLFTVLFISGIVYLYFRDFAPPPADPFSVVSSPWQPWMIKLHVLLAPLFVFCFGWISVTHTWSKLKKKAKRGKRTGLFNIGLLVIAIFTGYLIQTITHEWGNKIVSNLHIYISILCFLAVFIHQGLSIKRKP